MKKQFIDPLKIKKSQCPCAVLSAHDTNGMSWLIRLFTASSYNHIMTMRRPGYVCTQGWGFKEIPVEEYMKKRCRMKFWIFPKMTEVRKQLLCAILQKRLERPWYRQTYDVLGVLGQAINVRWLNNPFSYYCSEQFAEDWTKAYKNIPGKPSPEDINALFKTWPEAEVLGYWQND